MLDSLKVDLVDLDEVGLKNLKDRWKAEAARHKKAAVDARGSFIKMASTEAELRDNISKRAAADAHDRYSVLYAEAVIEVEEMLRSRYG